MPVSYLPEPAFREQSDDCLYKNPCARRGGSGNIPKQHGIQRKKKRRRRMCYHHLYIFTTCGHSVKSYDPILPCAAYKASHQAYPASRPSSARRTAATTDNDGRGGCNVIKFKPYRSHRLHRLCLSCSMRREDLLSDIDSATEVVRIDESKWRVAYRNPAAEQNWSLEDEASYGTVGPEEMERRMDALRNQKMGRARNGQPPGGPVGR